MPQQGGFGGLWLLPAPEKMRFAADTAQQSKTVQTNELPLAGSLSSGEIGVPFAYLNKIKRH